MEVELVEEVAFSPPRREPCAAAPASQAPEIEPVPRTRSPRCDHPAAAAPRDRAECRRSPGPDTARKPPRPSRQVQPTTGSNHRKAAPAQQAAPPVASAWRRFPQAASTICRRVQGPRSPAAPTYRCAGQSKHRPAIAARPSPAPTRAVPWRRSGPGATTVNLRFSRPRPPWRVRRCVAGMSGDDGQRADMSIWSRTRAVASFADCSPFRLPPDSMKQPAAAGADININYRVPEMIRNIMLMRLAFGLLRPPHQCRKQEAAAVRVDVVGGSVRRRRRSPSRPCRRARRVRCLGRQIADVVASDLRSTGAVHALGPGGIPGYPYPQATAPGYWRMARQPAPRPLLRLCRAARRRPDHCCLLPARRHRRPRSSAARAIVVAPATGAAPPTNAPTCVYSRLSGEGAFLDTRVVYVAETGPRDQPRQAHRHHGFATAPTTAT